MAGVIQSPVIQRQVNVQTADMGKLGLGKRPLRRPAAHQDHILPVFSQELTSLEQDGTRGLHFDRRDSLVASPSGFDLLFQRKQRPRHLARARSASQGMSGFGSH